MAVTINGILCNELVDGYTEMADIQSGYGARKGYICNWPDRFAVIHGILGLSSAPSLGGLITLQVPMKYPELAAESSNSLASCYARSVEVYGVGPPTQGASNVAFQTAKIYVTFGAYPWSFTGIDYLQLDPSNPFIWAEQHLDFSAEYITVPGKSVFFKTTPARLDQPYGFLSPLVDMSITLKQVPYLPALQIINATQAPINNSLYLGCAAGYLMFKGARSERTQSSDGTQTTDLTCAFTFRPIAQWDQVYHGAANAWDQVVNGSGNALIARSNLATIIPAAYQI